MNNLPSKIIDGMINGIKAIFVPDTEYIDQKMDAFTDMLKEKFNFDTAIFEDLFQKEAPVTDVDMEYDIPGLGVMHLPVLDVSFFKQGIVYFRPYIRGFLVLMMFLYHIRQLIGFFGYDAGVVAGRSEHIKSARESQKGE